MSLQAFLKKGGSTLSNLGDGQSTSGESSSGKGKKAVGEKQNKNIPWVEKYRPKSISDVAHQDEVVNVLRSTLETGADLPNLLFYGPPGTGKTSTILAAAREIFGPEMYRTRILELNASDERGIDVIRTKIKTFAQLSASAAVVRKSDGKMVPPFKLIILDEADSMTNSAQAALRRTMEKESRTTRFCLLCNYVSRIIGPLTSRCSKFRFKPVPASVLESRLLAIAESEGVLVEPQAIAVLIQVTEGDMRQAITTLQSAARLKGSKKVEGPSEESSDSSPVVEAVTEEDVFEITGVVPSRLIAKLMTACASDSYDKLDSVVQEIIEEGFSAGQVLYHVHDAVVASDEMNDKQKSVVCEALGAGDKCLADGADEYLQLMSVCCTIMQTLCRST